jgi:cytochrome c oxidase cbb3-type subunit 3
MSADHTTTASVPRIDAVTGTATTGHEWDGIAELNTPMPRWWLWTFYLCIAWAAAYWVVYPAWPLLAGHTPGLAAYSSRAAVAVEIEALGARRAVQAAGLATASLAEIRANPDLFRIAVAQGKAAFGDNCSGCHGLGGGGAKGGYPNLNDDDWLWGGALEDIHTTLQNGIRWTANEQTRQSPMAAYGRDGILKRDEIRAVANHVRSLAGFATEANADLPKGKAVFEQQCAACHGDQGKGNREVGAPNLTDAIWLYGSDLETIVETLTNGRGGVMPAWAGRLDPVTIKAVTIYVHSLGGGQ